MPANPLKQYPKVKNPNLVGKYPGVVKAGGGYVWDDVLEYRVWCHPHDGALDTEDGNDYYFVFETYEEAPKPRFVAHETFANIKFFLWSFCLERHEAWQIVSKDFR
jgi:hypothetical protein